MGSSREAETFLLSANPPMRLIWSLKGEEDMVSPVRLVTMVSRSSDDSLSTCDTRLEPEAAIDKSSQNMWLLSVLFAK